MNHFYSETQEVGINSQNPDDAKFVHFTGVLLLLAVVNTLSKYSFAWFKWKYQVGVLGISVLFFIVLNVVGRKIKSRRRTLQGSDAFQQKKGSVTCGKTRSGERVYLHPHQRAMHTQVIGTTNAGKTESVVLPWAIQDIRADRGLIIIDGKSDRGILDKLYAYVVKAGRERDFKLFSLSNMEFSHQFNPLVGGSTQEITERVFNAFEFENPYYRAIQFEVMSQLMRVFEALKITPTFERLHGATTNPDVLADHVSRIEDPALRSWLESFMELSPKDRLERTSGLATAFAQFSFGETSALFSAEVPSIDISMALRSRQILYFQLPVLLSPFLGKATGKLVLQSLQGAIANRHRGAKSQEFFSVYLDDFTEYLYPGFVSILNKSRSANVGVVFAHQALGDIKALGEPIANAILTNSNIKVFMRGNDPESAEYYSRVIGTKATRKFTEQTKRSWLGDNSTGDASARDVEEFMVHPNKFKSGLGLGEAVIVLPHERGGRVEVVRFEKYPELTPRKLANPPQPKALGLEAILKER